MRFEATETEAGAARVVTIARLAHEVNRAYCEAIGDSSQVQWEQAPAWQRESAIAGVNAILSSGLKLTPQEIHARWKAHKIAEGWVYGPVKDPVNKEHPCIVEYADLPEKERIKDILFSAVVTSSFK